MIFKADDFRPYLDLEPEKTFEQYPQRFFEFAAKVANERTKAIDAAVLQLEQASEAVIEQVRVLTGTRIKKSGVKQVSDALEALRKAKSDS